MLHLYLYYLLIAKRDKFENLLELNEKKETKLKFISNKRNFFKKKGIDRGRMG